MSAPAELVLVANARLPSARAHSLQVMQAAAAFARAGVQTTLVHARRTQILPEQYRSRVFNVKTPNSVNTFLVDGQGAGTWKHDKGRIKVTPFRQLDQAVRRELDEEGERLAAFHA